MSQSNSERAMASRGAATALAVMLILMFSGIIFFMAYSHLPRAGAGNSNTTSDLVTPTVAMTRPIGSLTLNRNVVVNGVQITVTQVQQAAGFSDVQQQAGPYTVRVYVQTKNSGQAPVGINFSAQARLLLPDGRAISPRVMSISPVMMPHVTQVGFFDFPVQKPVSLRTLTLHLDTQMVISFDS